MANVHLIMRRRKTIVNNMGELPRLFVKSSAIKKMEGRELRQFDAVLQNCAGCQRKAQKEGSSRRQLWRLSLPILPRGSPLIHAFVCALTATEVNSYYV